MLSLLSSSPLFFLNTLSLFVVFVIGDTGTGKSCCLHQFVEGKCACVLANRVCFVGLSCTVLRTQNPKSCPKWSQHVVKSGYLFRAREVHGRYLSGVRATTRFQICKRNHKGIIGHFSIPQNESNTDHRGSQNLQNRPKRQPFGSTSALKHMPRKAHCQIN